MIYICDKEIIVFQVDQYWQQPCDSCCQYYLFSFFIFCSDLCTLCFCHSRHSLLALYPCPCQPDPDIMYKQSRSDKIQYKLSTDQPEKQVITGKKRYPSFLLWCYLICQKGKWQKQYQIYRSMIWNYTGEAITLFETDNNVKRLNSVRWLKRQPKQVRGTQKHKMNLLVFCFVFL